MSYVYRTGYSVPGVNANDAAAELQRIHADAGELTTDVVIEAARDESAVLHPAFEWDMELAAREHWKQQARQLIKGICIERENSDPVPMHFHITTNDGGRYEPVENIANDPDLYDAALAELSGKVRGAQAAVDQLMTIGAKRLKGKKRKAVESVRENLSEASEALAALS